MKLSKTIAISAAVGALTALAFWIWKKNGFKCCKVKAQELD
jgi:hypothetical protein